MPTEAVRSDLPAIARHWTPTLFAGLVLLGAAPLCAQTPVTLPPVSVGAGLQTSFVHTSPDGGDSTDAFPLNSVRLYVSGSAAPKIKFMFNTEYDGKSDHIGVLDAAAQFEMSGKFNIWVGQFIAPSDRANLYGPYYSNHWAVYSDGVQDGYPSVGLPAPTGRDRGVMYWGQFDKVKLSGGVFDGATLGGGNSKVLLAGRAQVDFWDPEAGYYLNGTYLGAKNLLAIGFAAEAQKAPAGSASDWNSACSFDFLLEKKVPGGGAFTVESEYAKYTRLGGYKSAYAESEGGYGLASYLFPPMMGMTGKFEVLGKFAQANFKKGLTTLDKDYNQKTSEVDFNYIIRDFNARIMIFFKDTRFDAIETNNKQFGVGVQLQM